MTTWTVIFSFIENGHTIEDRREFIGMSLIQAKILAIIMAKEMGWKLVSVS